MIQDELKNISKETNRFFYLIEKLKQKPVASGDSIIKESLVNYAMVNKEIEYKVFLYNIKETEIVNTLLEKISVLDESVQKQISAKEKIEAIKKEKTKNSKGFSIAGVAALIAGALIFTHLKGYKLPFIGSITNYFKSHDNILNLLNDNFSVDKSLKEFLLPDLNGIDNILDRFKSDEEDENIPAKEDNTDEDSSLLNEAIDRINGARSSINAISTIVKDKMPVLFTTVKKVTSFVFAVSPFGLINLLFGRQGNMMIKTLSSNISGFYRDFWQYASGYVKDLFKWIQLKNIVSPVTGLVSGFASFVSKSYSMFARQFSNSTNTNESRRLTQSSVLATTALIFTGLTSTLSPANNTTFQKDFVSDEVSIREIVTENKQETVTTTQEVTEMVTVTETVTVGSGGVWIMGDSLAAGYQKETRYPGNPIGGKDTTYILKHMVPEFIQANKSGAYSTVVLSCGISNEPHNAREPNKTERGFTNVNKILTTLLNSNNNLKIILMGVSNINTSYDTPYGKNWIHEGPKINARLAQMAAQHGGRVIFTGPMPEKYRSDKLHARNYKAWVGTYSSGSTQTITRQVPVTRTVTTTTPSSNGNKSTNTTPTATQSQLTTAAGSSNDPRIAGYVRYVLAHRASKPGGNCSMYVRKAIQSTMPHFKQPVDACDNHLTGNLAAAGFKLVHDGIYNGKVPAGIKTGDIVVWNRGQGAKHNHKSGHISITVNDSGKQCSEWLQNNFHPGSDYNNGRWRFWIYRLPPKNTTASVSTGASTAVPTSNKHTRPSSNLAIGDVDTTRLKTATTQTDYSENQNSVVTVNRSSNISYNANSGSIESKYTQFLKEVFAVSKNNVIRIQDNNDSIVVNLHRDSNGNVTATKHSQGNTSNYTRMNLNAYSTPGNMLQQTIAQTTKQGMPEVSGQHPLDLLLGLEINCNMASW